MITVTYTIPNISCNHCIHTIKTELGDLTGVRDVSANLETKQVTIVFDTPASKESIETLLAEINYPAAN